MSGADKRGQLSSGLLGAKGAGTGPAAHGTGALKLASESAEEQPIEPVEMPPAEPEADILYTKGDASASTFRPSYWTFERKANEAGSGATVTPISAAVAGRFAAEAPSARTTPPAKPLWYRRTANIAVLSFSASALLASAAFFVLSLQHQPPSPPGAASVPTATASAPASPPLSPPVSPVQPIVGVVVPLPGGTSAAPAASEPSTAVATAPAPSALSEPSIPPVPTAPPVTAVAPTRSASVAPTPVVAAPASSAGATAVAPAPSPAEPTPSAAPVQPSAPPAPAAPVVAAIPPQAPASTEATAAPAAASKPETAPSEVAVAPAEEATQDALPLMARGDELRFVGDFTAARLFYERAAEQGSAVAARAVGETYDPFVLEEAHALGVRADARTAANWYRKAIEGGDTQAAQRLQRLMTKPAN